MKPWTRCLPIIAIASLSASCAPRPDLPKTLTGCWTARGSLAGEDILSIGEDGDFRQTLTLGDGQRHENAGNWHIVALDGDARVVFNNIIVSGPMGEACASSGTVCEPAAEFVTSPVRRVLGGWVLPANSDVGYVYEKTACRMQAE